MNRKILFALLLVGFHVASISAAPIQGNALAPASIDDAKKSTIQQMINKVIPELIVETVSHSPLSGIYQIIANNEIFYVSEDGRYLLHGDLLDLTKDKATLNQTEEIRKKIRLKSLNNVPKSEMIIFSPTNGIKSFVTIFTDADCVFCQRFHKEISKITELGIEVRYLSFPRQGIGSDSYKKTVSIWCADDPKSMLTLAKNGGTVPSKSCEAPVAKHYELGRKLNIQGTPTIIFADGTMLARYMLPDELAKFALEHQPDNIKVTE